MVKKVKVRVVDSWADSAKSGSPDYAPEVSSGAMLPKVLLRDNETLVMVGLLATPHLAIAPHAIPPIAPGGFSRLYIANTGITTPYAVLVGHTIAVLNYWNSFDQPNHARYIFDGIDWLEKHEEAHKYTWEHEVHTGYVPFDPTGLLPHTIDYMVYNDGAAAMRGSILYWIKDIVLGTEIPEVKEVRCTTCQTQHIVPREAGVVECPVCGNPTIYLPNLFGSEVRRGSKKSKKIKFKGDKGKVKIHATKEVLDKLKKEGKMKK